MSKCIQRNTWQFHSNNPVTAKARESMLTFVHVSLDLLCTVCNITTEPPTTRHSVSCFFELWSWFGVKLSSKYMNDNVAKNSMYVSNTGRCDVEDRIPATYSIGLGFKF
jgi:hypothetical protein